jgi:heme/copper-type cytochrome/quinol oxidase subunit 4
MANARFSLIFAWVQLMALSAALALAGGGASPPGSVGIVIIAAVAAIKARIVLRSYLGLSRAPGALAGFFAAVFTVLAIVAVSFLIFPTPARTSGAPAAFAPTFAGGNE